jgi:hypothetical protein
MQSEERRVFSLNTRNKVGDLIIYLKFQTCQCLLAFFIITTQMLIAQYLKGTVTKSHFTNFCVRNVKYCNQGPNIYHHN